MYEEVQFWFHPTTGTVVWFLITTGWLTVLAISVRLLFVRMQNTRRENEFQALLQSHGLLGKPEEDVLRDIVERHKISPPANILANLSAYDQIASEEIHRAERAPIPLSERVDRIEYLYSIRMRAFGNETSVGGIRNLIPNAHPNIAAKSEFAAPKSSPLPPPRPAEDHTRDLDREDEFNGLGLGDEDHEMAKLLGGSIPTDPSASN